MSVPESLLPFRTAKVFHRTWAGTFYCKPQAIFQPTCVEEIQELVKQARIHKKTIMTVGSGHSPSDLTMTDEWLCNLDKFNRVIKQEEFSGPTKTGDSKEVKYVDLTVEAGTRIYELNSYLKSHKLAIQNLGSISDQSIAGLISTGTHGSTQYHGLVSQQVVLISLLKGNGELVTCSSVENENLFRAALLGLGKIGIITHVTIRTCPQYTIKSVQEVITFELLLERWDTVWLESEFIRVWWFPYSGKCVLWQGSKSDEPLSAPRASWYQTRFGRLFYESLLWVAVHIFPRLTPTIERFVFGQQFGLAASDNVDIAVQNSVEGLNLDCLFSQFVNEWSCPMTNGVHALKEIQDAVNLGAQTGAFYSHAPIEVRCSNTLYLDKPFVNDNGEPSLHPSQSWLATRDRWSEGPIPGNNLRPWLDNSPDTKYTEGPVTNEQLSLFVNATMYRPFYTNVGTHTWYQIFENIMFESGGKPHWAKNFIGVDGDQKSSADLSLQSKYGGKPFYAMIGFKPLMREWFGDRLVEFNKVRKETDPEGVFLSGKAWADRNGVLI